MNDVTSRPAPDAKASELRAPDGRCLFRLHASMAILDPAGRILLVQEAKPAARGRWNLPGGHIDHGESAPAAAIRETREETHLSVEPYCLLGIYSSRHAVRFVFLAVRPSTQPPTPGDEVLAVQWLTPEQIVAMNDAALIVPAMLRQIVTDIAAGRKLPLDTVTHISPL